MRNWVWRNEEGLGSLKKVISSLKTVITTAFVSNNRANCVREPDECCYQYFSGMYANMGVQRSSVFKFVIAKRADKRCKVHCNWVRTFLENKAIPGNHLSIGDKDVGSHLTSTIISQVK